MIRRLSEMWISGFNRRRRFALDWVLSKQFCLEASGPQTPTVTPVLPFVCQ